MQNPAGTVRTSQSSVAAPPPVPDARTLQMRLSAVGQEHLLAFHEALSPAEQVALRAQIASIELSAIPRLVDQFVKSKPKADLLGAIQPAPYYPLRTDTRAKPWDRDEYKSRGEALIREGKVAAFTVAGGQGSRLGYDGPKGCFPGGAVTNKPLFACLADWILAAQDRYGRESGKTIPWYVMTSPGNHQATVDFFREHSFFGLAECDVWFFPQGVMPALDINTGRILLEAPGTVALAPDGHGGSLRALAVSGAVADMRRRGIEYISYSQIDNPLVRVIDPVFLGLHAFAPDSSGEMSSKMVVKSNPGEKVGVLCRIGDRTGIIEYSDLPDELARKKGPDGALAFNAGSIAIHIISVAFVEKLNGVGNGGASGAVGSAFSLPFHRAEKKVACIDHKTGKRLEPDKPNAVKLETFVFDAIPLARSSIVMETDRTEEFAPIKNAAGADSPETCRAIQTLRAAKWLEAAGVRIPRKPDGTPNCTLELSPRTAMFSEDLGAPGGTLPSAIAPGASLSL
ncbi:MAG: UTP--glucose-1-phosphate uridylyltransferase [Phycisphaerales bacterium]